MIRLDLSTRRDRRAIIEGSHGTYVADDKGFCSCPGGTFRSSCKHQREVGSMPVKFGDVAVAIKRYPSSIKGLNAAFGGDLYNNDAIVTFYGKYHVGKSLLVFQDMCSSGGNVLWIDCEGGMKNMIEKWLPVFTSRFGKSGEMYLETRKTLTELTDFLGFNTNVVFQSKDKKGEKGKMEFRIIESQEEGPIDSFIKDAKIDAIVLDSISSPVRQIMTDNQQDNPTKATAQALILGKLLSLQDRYGTIVVVTAHASVNPTDQYAMSIDVKMRGGIVLHHFSKRVIYIDAREMRGLRDYRRLWVVRSEDMPRFSAVVGAKISNVGFEDYEDVNGLLTQREAEVLGVK